MVTRKKKRKAFVQYWYELNWYGTVSIVQFDARFIENLNVKFYNKMAFVTMQQSIIRRMTLKTKITQNLSKERDNGNVNLEKNNEMGISW